MEGLGAKTENQKLFFFLIFMFSRLRRLQKSPGQTMALASRPPPPGPSSLLTPGWVLGRRRPGEGGGAEWWGQPASAISEPSVPAAHSLGPGLPLAPWRRRVSLQAGKRLRAGVR